MKKKVMKNLVLALLVLTTIFSCTIGVGAISMEGDSASGGGASSTANGAFSVPYGTARENLVGWRFSAYNVDDGSIYKLEDATSKMCIDIIVKDKVSKYTSAYYILSPQLPKTQYVKAYGSVSNTNGPTNKSLIGKIQSQSVSSFSKKTVMREGTDISFYDALPGPYSTGDLSGLMFKWQNENKNLNKIVEKFGFADVNAITTSDRIIVEPIYEINIPDEKGNSQAHFMTPTEMAWFSGLKYGFDCNGWKNTGAQSGTDGNGTWGFIGNFTHRHYPASLYTQDDKGMGWNDVAPDVANDVVTKANGKWNISALTSRDIVRYGYGVAILYSGKTPGNTTKDLKADKIVYAYYDSNGNPVRYYCNADTTYDSTGIKVIKEYVDNGTTKTTTTYTTRDNAGSVVVIPYGATVSVYGNVWNNSNSYKALDINAYYVVGNSTTPNIIQADTSNPNQYPKAQNYTLEIGGHKWFKIATFTANTLGGNGSYSLAVCLANSDDASITKLTNINNASSAAQTNGEKNIGNNWLKVRYSIQGDVKAHQIRVGYTDPTTGNWVVYAVQQNDSGVRQWNRGEGKPGESTVWGSWTTTEIIPELPYNIQVKVEYTYKNQTGLSAQTDAYVTHNNHYTHRKVTGISGISSTTDIIGAWNSISYSYRVNVKKDSSIKSEIYFEGHSNASGEQYTNNNVLAFNYTVDQVDVEATTIEFSYKNGNNQTVKYVRTRNSDGTYSQTKKVGSGTTETFTGNPVFPYGTTVTVRVMYTNNTDHAVTIDGYYGSSNPGTQISDAQNISMGKHGVSGSGYYKWFSGISSFTVTNSGTFTTRVYLDGKTTATGVETNDTNNVLSWSYTVEKIDIKASKITYSYVDKNGSTVTIDYTHNSTSVPEIPYGVNVTVTGVIWNNSASCAGVKVDGYYESTNTSGEKQIANGVYYEINESRTYSLGSFTATPLGEGSYTLKAYETGKNRSTSHEIYPGNNVLTAPYKVVGDVEADTIKIGYTNSDGEWVSQSFTREQALTANPTIPAGVELKIDVYYKNNTQAPLKIDGYYFNDIIQCKSATWSYNGTNQSSSNVTVNGYQMSAYNIVTNSASWAVWFNEVDRITTTAGSGSITASVYFDGKTTADGETNEENNVITLKYTVVEEDIPDDPTTPTTPTTPPTTPTTTPTIPTTQPTTPTTEPTEPEEDREFDLSAYDLQFAYTDNGSTIWLYYEQYYDSSSNSYKCKIYKTVGSNGTKQELTTTPVIPYGSIVTMYARFKHTDSIDEPIVVDCFYQSNSMANKAKIPTYTGSTRTYPSGDSYSFAVGTSGYFRVGQFTATTLGPGYYKSMIYQEDTNSTSGETESRNNVLTADFIVKGDVEAYAIQYSYLTADGEVVSYLVNRIDRGEGKTLVRVAGGDWTETSDVPTFPYGAAVEVTLYFQNNSKANARIDAYYGSSVINLSNDSISANSHITYETSGFTATSSGSVSEAVYFDGYGASKSTTYETNGSNNTMTSYYVVEGDVEAVSIEYEYIDPDTGKYVVLAVDRGYGDSGSYRTKVSTNNGISWTTNYSAPTFPYGVDVTVYVYFKNNTEDINVKIDGRYNGNLISAANGYSLGPDVTQWFKVDQFTANTPGTGRVWTSVYYDGKTTADGETNESNNVAYSDYIVEEPAAYDLEVVYTEYSYTIQGSTTVQRVYASDPNRTRIVASNGSETIVNRVPMFPRGASVTMYVQFRNNSDIDIAIDGKYDHDPVSSQGTLRFIPQYSVNGTVVYPKAENYVIPARGTMIFRMTRFTMGTIGEGAVYTQVFQSGQTNASGEVDQDNNAMTSKYVVWGDVAIEIVFKDENGDVIEDPNNDIWYGMPYSIYFKLVNNTPLTQTVDAYLGNEKVVMYRSIPANSMVEVLIQETPTQELGQHSVVGKVFFVGKTTAAGECDQNGTAQETNNVDTESFKIQAEVGITDIIFKDQNGNVVPDQMKMVYGNRYYIYFVLSNKAPVETSVDLYRAKAQFTGNTTPEMSYLLTKEAVTLSAANDGSSSYTTVYMGWMNATFTSKCAIGGKILLNGFSDCEKELDPNNNVRVETINTIYYDLAITDIVFSDPQGNMFPVVNGQAIVPYGEKVAVWYIVTNNSSVSNIQGFVYDVLDPTNVSQKLGTVAFSSSTVNGGGTAKVFAGYLMPEDQAIGIATINGSIYRAGYTNANTEVNTTNNKRTEEIKFVFDIEISDIYLTTELGTVVDPENIPTNTNLYVHYVLKNHNPLPITTNVYAESDSGELSKLSPNGSQQVELEANGTLDVIVGQIQYTTADEITLKGHVYRDGQDPQTDPYEATFDNNQWEYAGEIVILPYLTPITPNAAYREGTDVISSFWLHNESDVAYNGVGSGRLDVHFVVKDRGGNIITEMVKPSIVPANNKQLVYFKWTVPEDYNYDNFVVEAYLYVYRVDLDLSHCSNVRAYCTADDRFTPDTVYEENKPDDWERPTDPINRTGNNYWWEWKYEGGTFVKYNYGISVSSMNMIAQPESETAYKQGGKWYMKSGYGISLKGYGNPIVRAITSGGRATPSEDAYTSFQYMYATFPEFEYSRADGCIATLEQVQEGTSKYWRLLEFEDYGRIHFTPIWYPDGNYKISVIASDVWTPMGMIVSQTTASNMNIRGDMYDDWYVGHD